MGARAQDLLNAMISQMDEGVLLLDEDKQIVLINLAAEEMLDWPHTELLGEAFEDKVHQHPDKACRLWQAMDTGESLKGYQDTFKKSDGTQVTVCYELTHIRLSERLAGFAITFHMIGENLSPAFLPSYQGKTLSFKHLFESNMFGMIYGDVHNYIFETNDSFLDMLGYSMEDFTTGKIGWKELTPEEYGPFDEIALQQLKEYGAFRPYEKQLIRKDGSRIDILAGGILEEGSAERTVAFIIDITPKKQFERALIEGEKLFRLMAEASPMMVWFVSPQGKNIYFNKRALDYAGVSAETLERMGWEPFIHPEDISPHIELLTKSFQTKSYFENEIRARCSDGSYHWLWASGGPVFSPEGEFIGIIGAATDIQNRKTAEAKLAEYAQRLERSNKELEQFATIVSHDLQEPLRKVMVFTDHVKYLDHALKEEALDDIERIQRATGRMQRLITDLLDLSRVIRRGAPFQKVDLHSVTQEVIAELSYTYKGIRGRVQVTGNMTIEADLNQIRQMMTQLLDNAFKFHKPNQPSHVKIIIKPIEDNQCQICISDDGIGMKTESLSKIFDTFVRLHGVEYSGTGMGLALVKKIVERHGGGIEVKSTPGEGSTFTIILPVIQKNE